MSMCVSNAQSIGRQRIMNNISVDDDGRSRSQRKRRGNRIVLGSLSLVVFVIVGILIGDRAFTAYDRSHVIKVECEVISAEATRGGSTSGRGAGTLFDQIEIATKDCGPLVLRRGVSESNKGAIAAELDAGGRVSFGIGAASYDWRLVLHALRTPVIVNGFEE